MNTTSHHFLDKKVVKAQLVDSALYLMAFHLLKLSIVEGVRDFFVIGIDKDGQPSISGEYEQDVLARAKSRFEASLLFLRETEAITAQEFEEIQTLRQYRNKLAHDIPSTLYEKQHAVDPQKIERAGQLLDKIDNCWGRIEADINPDVDHDAVDYDGVTSMRSVVFLYIANIVREDDDNI